MMAGWLFEDGPALRIQFSRVQPIATKLVEIFNVSEATTRINIVDRYIDNSLLKSLKYHVEQEEPTKEKYKIRNNLWATLIQEFAESMAAGEINIITAEKVQAENRAHWIYNKGNGVFPRLGGKIFKATNIPGHKINTNLTVLSWNNDGKDPLLSPLRIHDRIILIDDKGWHLGCSLNSLKSADLLISEMDTDLVSYYSKRYMHMFDACSERNKR